METTDGQLENLEKLTSDLEFAKIEQQVLNGLKVGNEALKKIHEVLPIEEVERIMDETKEGIEKVCLSPFYLSFALVFVKKKNCIFFLNKFFFEKFQSNVKLMRQLIKH